MHARRDVVQDALPQFPNTPRYSYDLLHQDPNNATATVIVLHPCVRNLFGAITNVHPMCGLERILQEWTPHHREYDLAVTTVDQHGPTVRPHQQALRHQVR